MIAKNMSFNWIAIYYYVEEKNKIEPTVYEKKNYHFKRKIWFERINIMKLRVALILFCLAKKNWLLGTIIFRLSWIVSNIFLVFLFFLCCTQILVSKYLKGNYLWWMRKRKGAPGFIYICVLQWSSLLLSSLNLKTVYFTLFSLFWTSPKYIKHFD